MPFTIDDFIRRRPFVFHLTARANVARIRESAALQPAALMLKESRNDGLLRTRRRTSLQPKLDGKVVHIRDQRPLHAGNIDFQGGWTIEDLVGELNERVFFWPGSAGWVVSYAHRHYGRYANERPVILRAELAQILALNGVSAPHFCKYNSGSPRWTNGKASPRGPNTFVKCDETTFPVTGVVEVTFRSIVHLPASVEITDSYDGKWRRL